MPNIEHTMTAFNGLGLNAKLIQNITAKGYDTPSPIQAKAIPKAVSYTHLTLPTKA